LARKIAINDVIFLAIHVHAPKITKVIPPSNAYGILRIVAFILLCIGVQIAGNGLADLLTTVASF